MIKTHNDSAQILQQKSSVMTRSRRKKSARLEEPIQNEDNASYSSKNQLDDTNHEHLNDITSILNSFSLFISDVNKLELDYEKQQNLMEKSVSDENLKKRCDKTFDTQENSDIQPQRSKRIKQFQKNKNKHKKKAELESNKQKKKLETIYEKDNFNSNKNQLNDTNNSQEIVKTKTNRNLKKNKDITNDYNQKDNVSNPATFEHTTINNNAQKINESIQPKEIGKFIFFFIQLF